jgi:hypothetical protein
MGDYGFPSRILASRMGSLFCYTSLDNADMPLAAPGQTSPESFVETYRGRDTKVDSDLYALLGDRGILSSLSPSLHNTAFRSLKKDALLVPMPSETIEEALENLGLFNVKGAAITVPHKEAVLPYLSFQSTDVQRIGACNTLVAERAAGRVTTPTPTVSNAASSNFWKGKIQGMKVTLIRRRRSGEIGRPFPVPPGSRMRRPQSDHFHRRALARKIRFYLGPPDDRAIEVVTRYSDLIVQATSLGMKGGIDAIPWSSTNSMGNEKVYDLIYKPSKPLARPGGRGAAAGLPTATPCCAIRRRGSTNYGWASFPPAVIMRGMTMSKSAFAAIVGRPSSESPPF